MQIFGSLEECLDKLYDLYMKGRVSDYATASYLGRMADNGGKLVFTFEEVEKMLEILKKAKREV